MGYIPVVPVSPDILLALAPLSEKPSSSAIIKPILGGSGDWKGAEAMEPVSKRVAIVKISIISFVFIVILFSEE